MRSPILEPGNLGNAMKIKTLSREPGNPESTISPVRCKLLFMGDLADIQFQPILQDFTEVSLGAGIQANLQSNRVHKTNNCKWSGEQKHRIVEIDHQKRKKGKNFMKRIKTR